MQQKKQQIQLRKMQYNIESGIKFSLDLYLTKQIEKVFVIGGVALYEYALKSVLLEKVYLTKINKNYDCDLHWPKELLFEKCWNDAGKQVDITDTDTELSFQTFEPKKKFEGEYQYIKHGILQQNLYLVKNLNLICQKDFRCLQLKNYLCELYLKN